MKKTRKGRLILELGTFLACFFVVFFSFTQIFVISRHSGGVSSRTMVTKIHNVPKNLARQERAAEPKAPVAPEKPKKAITAIQSRIRARAKAQAEVRELERMLAKLMRANNMTPAQSLAKFRTDHYSRRISQIIQQASEHSVQPHMTNMTRLRKPDQQARLQSGRIELQADFLNLLSNANSSASQPSVFQSHKLVPLSILHDTNQTGDDQATLNILDILRKRKSRTLMHKFKQLNRTEEEEMRNLATVQPPSEDNFFREELDRFEDGKRSVSEGRELFVDEEALIAESGRNVCPRLPGGLVGSISHLVNLTQSVSIDEVLENNTDVQEGGEWRPADCVSRHRVAIIIPYRDRWAHLKVLLYHLVPILKRQQIHFRIFVAEQHGNDTFNKGLLMNAAFREAIKLFDFQCVTFHDVDLVPEDDRNMYSCSDQPKHMSLSIDKFAYVLPYEGLVGGVLSFQAAHFQLVNGYSNMYWGWGAEDDDMTIRIMHQGLRIYRPPAKVARYKMVKHDGRKISEVSVRMKLLRSAARRSKLEGLNNVNYKLVFIHTEKLFTHIMVNIGHQ